MQSKVTGERKDLRVRYSFLKSCKASKILVPRKNKTHLPRVPG